jgi:murein DD-endopeptidase MepM/ murein hydrolase activator NlpD
VQRPTPLTILLLVAAAFGFAAVWAPKIGVPGFIAACAAGAGYALWRHFDAGSASKRWLARASDRPIVLQPPFQDRWRVSAGGPDPRHNPYQHLTDQYFAYDFVRVAGDSWDAPILAPCDGMVVHVENRRDDAPADQPGHDRKHPFGNYVSIETPRGYVLLSQLKKESVLVRVGERVRAGDEVARCGNSGATHGAHVHVHAQSRPSQAIATAQGVPVAFIDRNAQEAMLLEYGDTVG